MTKCNLAGCRIFSYEIEEYILCLMICLLIVGEFIAVRRMKNSFRSSSP